MKTCSILALIGSLIAANSASGQYIVSVDYVQRLSTLDDPADRREQVASISVLAIPHKRFHAQAKIGKETFQVSGTVKPGAEGHVVLDVAPVWEKDGPVGRTVKSVSAGIQFDPMFVHAEKLDAVAQDKAEAEINQQRIRLEDGDVGGSEDDPWYRWLGDTFVIGGLVQNRSAGAQREIVRSYYYFRLKKLAK